MKAVCSFKTLVATYQNTQYHNSKDNVPVAEWLFIHQSEGFISWSYEKLHEDSSSFCKSYCVLLWWNSAFTQVDKEIHAHIGTVT